MTQRNATGHAAAREAGPWWRPVRRPVRRARAAANAAGLCGPVRVGPCGPVRVRARAQRDSRAT
jgi:hypothetical protein